MKCYDSRVLLATRKDLSAAQEQTVRRHIEACSTCRAFWETQERTSRLLRALPPPPAAVVNRVVQAAALHRVGGAAIRRPWGRPMLLAGAALGTLLTVLFGAMLRQDSLGVMVWPNIQTGGTGADAVPERSGAEIVAYIQRGDVWIKTLPDGEPRRVTDDGRATTPRLSPSGEYVAFLQADDLLVTNITRGETARIDTRGPPRHYAWSPTNDHLAHITGDGGLRFTLMATGQTTEIAAGAESIMSGLVAGSFAWSPDGRWLAYDLHGVRTEGDAPPRLYAGLWRSDGLETHEVYAVERPEGSGVAGQTVRVAGWSSDSQRILFWQPDSATTSFSAGGVPLLVTWAEGGAPRELAASMLPYDDFLARSPIGHNVAVVVGNGHDTTLNKSITLVDLPSGEALRLTGAEVAALAPAWSPDGAHIAYAAGLDYGQTTTSRTSTEPLARLRRIYIMQLNGSEQRQLTTDPNYRDERPLWLADGRRLLFARIDNAGQASLWLVNTDGSGLAQLVDDIATPKDNRYGRLAWDESFDLRLTRQVREVRPDSLPPTTQPAAPR